MSSALSRLAKWTLATGITFLIFMTLMRFGFFYHFKTSSYSFSNSLDAFLLGLRYDLRIACGIVLPLFLIGSLQIDVNRNRRFSAATIVRLFVALALLIAIILLLKNNKGGTGSIVSVIVLYAVVFLWL